MGGGTPRAQEAIAVRPDRPLKRSFNRQCPLAAPTPLLVSPLKGGRDEFSWAGCWYAHSSSLVIPPLRHSCAGRNPRTRRRFVPDQVLGGAPARRRRAIETPRRGLVRSCFDRADSGRFRWRSYLVGAFGGVQVCSDLFRFVQGVIGVDGCAEGVGRVGAWGGGH